MTRYEIGCWWNGLKVGFAIGAISISVLAVFGADGVHHARQTLKPAVATVAAAETHPPMASAPERYEITTGGVLTPEEMDQVVVAAARMNQLVQQKPNARRDEIGETTRGLK